MCFFSFEFIGIPHNKLMYYNLILVAKAHVLNYRLDHKLFDLLSQ